MSASLVGSEMCIRDSTCAGPRRRTRTPWSDDSPATPPRKPDLATARAATMTLTPRHLTVTTK
eukprot:68942-Alexandrium_andersonii.AAC.1